VLAINDVPLEKGPDGYDQRDIYQLLYEKGNSASLLVQRGPESEPELVELRFGGASGCDGWVYDVLSDDPYLGYVRIPTFSVGNASDLILEAIDLLERDQPLDGLILDIRHNPGGFEEDSVRIFTMGTFGTVGKLREDSSRQIYRIRGPVEWNETTPVVLLTDGNSHSAADYFAIAMKLSGRATLVGMPTAGNTDGWTTFNLADGSLIGLSVTIFALPDGSLIEDIGLMPDIRVPLGQWGLREQPDVQMQAAIEVLLDQMDP
jgi:carboxyl-terminal processing protease